MRIEETVLLKALSNFTGVKRRFTRTGEVDGILIIDDYGHHPVEIGAVLHAARSGAKGKVIAVVQPHPLQPTARPVRRASAPASTMPTW